VIAASDFDDGVRQLKSHLELAYDAIAFLTGNAVEPIAMILAAADDTFRARFFPPGDRALIHIGERPTRMPQIPRGRPDQRRNRARALAAPCRGPRNCPCICTDCYALARIRRAGAAACVVR
jgi:hypothetical protein